MLTIPTLLVFLNLLNLAFLAYLYTQNDHKNLTQNNSHKLIFSQSIFNSTVLHIYYSLY